MLRERGHDVEQAKDRFGEWTSDRERLHWCDEKDTILVSNNAREFEPSHHDTNHAGLFLIYDQRLPDEDLEGLARTVEESSANTEQTA